MAEVRGGEVVGLEGGGGWGGGVGGAAGMAVRWWFGGGVVREVQVVFMKGEGGIPGWTHVWKQRMGMSVWFWILQRSSGLNIPITVRE